MRVVISHDNDPAFNAAIEEHWFRNDELTEPVMFLYVNRRSILFGRNQIPWAECHVGACRSKGISMIRRLSGGGTVYHDFGNANYAYIVPRKSFAPETCIRSVISALSSLGIKGLTMNNHYSILMNERKVGGTAFALCGKTSLLHGCILVTTLPDHVEQALSLPPGRQIDGGHVASNRLPVSSLSEAVPELTTDAVQEALIRNCSPAGDIHTEHVDRETFSLDLSFASSLRRFTDDGWTFRSGMSFVMTEPLNGGRFKLNVSGSVINSALWQTPDGRETPVPSLFGRNLCEIDTMLQAFAPLQTTARL